MKRLIYFFGRCRHLGSGTTVNNSNLFGTKPKGNTRTINSHIATTNHHHSFSNIHLHPQIDIPQERGSVKNSRAILTIYP